MSRKCRYLQLFHYIIFRVRYNVVIKNCLNFTDRIPSFNYLDQENKKPLKKRGFKGGPTCTITNHLKCLLSISYERSLYPQGIKLIPFGYQFKFNMNSLF